jgi:hypothetical protein
LSPASRAIRPLQRAALTGEHPTTLCILVQCSATWPAQSTHSMHSFLHTINRVLFNCIMQGLHSR